MGSVFLPGTAVYQERGRRAAASGRAHRRWGSSGEGGTWGWCALGGGSGSVWEEEERIGGGSRRCGGQIGRLATVVSGGCALTGRNFGRHAGAYQCPKRKPNEKRKRKRAQPHEQSPVSLSLARLSLSLERAPPPPTAADSGGIRRRPAHPRDPLAPLLHLLRPDPTRASSCGHARPSPAARVSATTSPAWLRRCSGDSDPARRRRSRAGTPWTGRLLPPLRRRHGGRSSTTAPTPSRRSHSSSRTPSHGLAAAAQCQGEPHGRCLTQHETEPGASLSIATYVTAGDQLPSQPMEL